MVLPERTRERGGVRWPWHRLLATNLVSDTQAMWRVTHEDDQKAFELIVQRWRDPIVRLCTRMLGNAHRAEDLAQEVFLRLYLKRSHYEPSARFSTYLWRIAINLCIDEHRRQARHQETLLDESHPNPEGQEDRWMSHEPGPDESLELREMTGRVRLALERLPEAYRAVVVLRHYEGLRFREIGEILDIPEGTVKSRMAEALSRLGRMLSLSHNSNPARL